MASSDTATNATHTVPAQVKDPDRLAAVRRTRLLDTAPEESFDRLTRLVATLLGVPYAFVTVVDGTRSFRKSTVVVGAAGSAQQQSPVEESFCQYVIGAGRELIVTDVTADDRAGGNPSTDLIGVAAWAAFPVRSSDGLILGTFCAVDTVPREWTPHDLQVLETVSHAAAGEIALRVAAAEAAEATRQARSANAQAQAATLRAEAATGEAQRATLQALEAAEEAAMLSRTLQESLLPPHLPAIPGMQIAARYLRGGHGADVLGDFYDVFRSVRGGWGAVVGDVAGKGPQAAKTTALARYTLRASAARALLPSTNLTALNTALIDWFTDDAQFVTAVYASVRPHPLGFAVRVCCGGHDQALIRRADGTIEAIGHHGIILGYVPAPHLRDQRTVLRPGDTLVMYTDGVTEARRGGDLFGVDRLRDVLAGPAASAADIAAAVEAAVLDFSGRRITDDTAVLALRVIPFESPP
jgi:serine phosphatase RsbU (regulator of sigma subunit)